MKIDLSEQQISDLKEVLALAERTRYLYSQNQNVLHDLGFPPDLLTKVEYQDRWLELYDYLSDGVEGER